MKIMIILVVALVVVGVLAYVVMAMQSQTMPERLTLKKGVDRGMLLPCPDSPNCVCSEQHTEQDKQHFIAPVQGDKHTFDKLKVTIIAQGGIIQTEQDNYIHATFSTPIFRYVDDVELRFDAVNALVHVRSASRIGRSDFGVNRKRIEALVTHLSQ